MKGCLIYRLHHDVQNIIEIMDFLYRMKNTNKKYRQVFHFFDNIREYRNCPNSHGRCVVRCQTIKIHWMNGQYHKKNGPAVEWHGTKRWYYKDKLHREDGPAIEWGNGIKEWFYEGQPHREDGPAIEWANGYKAWYYEGKLHRLEGPAIEYANGRRNEYWEFGNRVK